MKVTRLNKKSIGVPQPWKYKCFAEKSIISDQIPLRSRTEDHDKIESMDVFKFISEKDSASRYSIVHVRD